ncbi:MAG: hypothetical protein NVS9B10_22290 [Nevskia sp.]
MTAERAPDLVTSVKVLVEAEAAAARLKLDLEAAQRRWIESSKTVTMARECVIRDLPAGEAVTVRVSQSEFVTVETVVRPVSGRPGLRVLRSRLASVRA